MITTRPMALTHCFKLEVFFTLIIIIYKYNNNRPTNVLQSGLC